jgi:hypothetical protein
LEGSQDFQEITLPEGGDNGRPQQEFTVSAGRIINAGITMADIKVATRSPGDFATISRRKISLDVKL